MNISQFNLQAKKIKDSQGRLKTLSKGPYSFVNIQDEKTFIFSSQKIFLTDVPQKKTKNVLFLGLGFNATEDCLPLCQYAENIYYHECDEFIRACQKESIERSIPTNFIPLTCEQVPEFYRDNFLQAELYLYRQNLSLFTKYWQTLLIELENIFYEKNFASPYKIFYPNNNKKLFLAGSPNDLMYKEVLEAVRHIDYQPLTVFDALGHEFSLQNTSSQYTYTMSAEQRLAHFLRQERPTLFLSINGRNIDPNGQIFALLNSLKIPLALWIVDNPYNILSAYKDDWWKECLLFVSDASFIPSLKEHGAKNIHYLPLAAHTCMQDSKVAPPKSQLLYVGHSAFKDREKFFSASNLDHAFLELQKDNIEQAFVSKQTIENNFHKLSDTLFKNQKTPLWPGNNFRICSHYTSELDLFHKSLWLSYLAQQLSQNFCLVGDAGWKNFIQPFPELFPQTDYYTGLCAYYKQAKFTLNITSLLMPSALTQRHFDVWMAEGFLLCNPSKGLDIFPENIINSITVTHPAEVITKINYFHTNTSNYAELKNEMMNHIRKEHTYMHRLNKILEKV